MSLGAASTSMGVVIVWRNYIFISTNSFVIPALYFMWSRTKNIIPNLNTLKNMKKLSKMKNIKRTTQILFLFSIVGFQIQAQEVLTIEDAIKIALENNYDIKLPKRPEG
jgi:uncharacterized membrane protein